jgi:GMP synthase-like glutamine amidotransferase
VTLDQSSLLFKGLGKENRVLLTHGDSVVKLGKGFVGTATSNSGILRSARLGWLLGADLLSGVWRSSFLPCSACENAERRMYAVQFHPEVCWTHRNSLLTCSGLPHALRSI